MNSTIWDSHKSKSNALTCHEDQAWGSKQTTSSDNKANFYTNKSPDMRTLASNRKKLPCVVRHRSSILSTPIVSAFLDVSYIRFCGVYVCRQHPSHTNASSHRTRDRMIWFWISGSVESLTVRRHFCWATELKWIISLQNLCMYD